MRSFIKKYKKLQPEVVIGLGEETEFVENQSLFKTVNKLHINLEDWLGDDLLECYPCYIITEKMKDVLESSTASGYEIRELKVTLDRAFDDNYHQGKPVPNLYWLEILGKENIHDLYLDGERNLHVSQYMLDLLRHKVTLKYLDVDPEKNEFDSLLDQMINESKAGKNSEK